MPSYSGVWTLSQQFQGRGQGLWPSLPGAPTIGTATAGLALCASVAFTAPACRGVPSTLTYTVTSTPGGITTTGAASPLVVTGLTAATAYTFRVRATNASGTGPCSAASNSVTAKLASCVVFSTAGTFSWVVPSGVTSIAGLTVGGGAGGVQFSGGGGGALAYVNGISVTPGETLTVEVGAGGAGARCSRNNGTASRIIRSGNVLVGANGGNCTGGGSRIVGSGGNGGTSARGGGGAGGYSSSGGAGAGATAAGGCGFGGSGGGGGGGCSSVFNSSGGLVNYSGSGAGGGVGIYGTGTSGAGGSAGYVACSYYAVGGGGGGAGSPSTGTGTAGGSGGTTSGSNLFGGCGGSGGLFGGGGGGGSTNQYCVTSGTCYYFPNGGSGGRGAVRIVWNGCGRGVPSFPSTNVGPS